MALVVGSIDAVREHCFVTIDAGQARAYALATDDENPAYGATNLVPPVFGVVPTWPATTRILEQLIPAESLPMLLHLEQDMRFHRPLTAGLELESEVQAYSTRVSAFGTRITVRTTGRDGTGEVVLDQFGTVVVRGLTGGVSEGPEKPDHGFPRHARQQRVASVSLPVDLDQAHRYSEASGDVNRIHIDEDFARRVGLPRTILHGLCTMAMCGRAVIDAMADGDPTRLRRLAVRFSKPVFPGNALDVDIYDAGDLGATRDRVYAFEATSDGERVIRDGRAEVAAAGAER